jgi:hypothetical protein
MCAIICFSGKEKFSCKNISAQGINLLKLFYLSFLHVAPLHMQRCNANNAQKIPHDSARV